MVLDGYKNPEYEIEKKLADRKTPTSLKYEKSLKKAAKQKCRIVVLDLSENKADIKHTAHKIESMLRRKQAYPSVEKVIIVSKNGKIVEVKRKKAT
ncbi:MAG: hypothetical protein V6Z82_04700 [Flavobacteriales bacterium]